MKRWIKKIGAVGALALLLPCTLTILLGRGRGLRGQEPLPELEYQVLGALLTEELAWMSDGMLDVMAVLYRTELLRTGQHREQEGVPFPEEYGRLYEAVARTKGKAVTIEGEYRELPYHGISAGRTRDGSLLGEEYAYVKSVECPQDLEAEEFLKICRLEADEAGRALGTEPVPEELAFDRDQADYVISMSLGERSWPGEKVRSLLHLPSSCFFMEGGDGTIRITSKGSGHGFGMSLYTADRMARDGAGFQEIFQKFYEGAECITIP